MITIHLPMNPVTNRRRLRMLLGLGMACFTFLSGPSARANVYATNIRLNGGTNNVSGASGGSVTISYLLNEDATAGVAIDIKSGAVTVRTISIAGGNPGATRGANSVIWDGKDNSSNNVPAGAYTVQITAAAAGYDDWTQISVDLSNYVYRPTGMAVNRNTNSFYYGRVFVGNATSGPNAATDPGDMVGIQKFNADGSPAAEGIFSSGGWPWAGNGFSPWKIEVAADDFVY